MRGRWVTSAFRTTWTRRSRSDRPRVTRRAWADVAARDKAFEDLIDGKNEPDNREGGHVAGYPARLSAAAAGKRPFAARASARRPRACPPGVRADGYAVHRGRHDRLAQAAAHVVHHRSRSGACASLRRAGARVVRGLQGADRRRGDAPRRVARHGSCIDVCERRTAGAAGLQSVLGSAADLIARFDEPMQHQVAEVAGSRVRIGYTVELTFDVLSPAEFIF